MPNLEQPAPHQKNPAPFDPNKRMILSPELVEALKNTPEGKKQMAAIQKTKETAPKKPEETAEQKEKKRMREVVSNILANMKILEASTQARVRDLSRNQGERTFIAGITDNRLPSETEIRQAIMEHSARVRERETVEAGLRAFDADADMSPTFLKMLDDHEERYAMRMRESLEKGQQNYSPDADRNALRAYADLKHYLEQKNP